MNILKMEILMKCLDMKNKTSVKKLELMVLLVIRGLLGGSIYVLLRQQVIRNLGLFAISVGHLMHVIQRTMVQNQ